MFRHYNIRWFLLCMPPEKYIVPNRDAIAIWKSFHFSDLADRQLSDIASFTETLFILIDVKIMLNVWKKLPVKWYLQCMGMHTSAKCFIDGESLISSTRAYGPRDMEF